MKICSLLPSATEILFALGLGDAVVGVTHECSFPPEARRKPRVVTSVIDQDAQPSREIDRVVVEHLRRGDSLYRVDADLLKRLQPDLLVTQELCEVCAIDAADVMASLRVLSYRPTVISLHPHTLPEALNDILVIGRGTGRDTAAADLVGRLQARIERVRRLAAQMSTAPRVCCLEWMDPVMASGHWVPEMVELAGGVDVLGKAGEPSRYVEWEDVVAAKPEVVLVMPCGFPIVRARRELHLLVSRPGWEHLPAVQRRQVYLVDGPAYFNQSGPRLVDGLEILASLINPSAAGLDVPAGAIEPVGHAG